MTGSQDGGHPRRQGRRTFVLAAGAISALLLVPTAASASSGGKDSVAASTWRRVPLARGGKLQPDMMGALRDPQGRRMEARGFTDTSDSTNWSGLGGVGKGIEGARAQWTVPAVRASASARYSSSWVGVDGVNDDDLIQTGTEQDTTDGYGAWVEILPAASVPIVQPDGKPAPVAAGDGITASVVVAGPGLWKISIEDTTQRWYFSQNYDYSGPGQSAEWVEEAPTVNGVQSSPSDFGTVRFSGTAVYGRFGSGAPAWYSTKMTSADEIAMVGDGGRRILAMPSAPSPSSVDGQGFSDTYVTAPGAPTGLKVTVAAGSVQLTWGPPHRSGGTPVVGYEVRVYRAGRLRRTRLVTGRSVTFGHLVDGAGYSFSDAARSSGDYTSEYSARTPVVRLKA